jgi:hypothetical protein
VGDQLVARPLPIHRATQPQNKRTQTFIPLVGFEATSPAFERAKAVHALDGAAAVISILHSLCLQNFTEVPGGHVNNLAEVAFHEPE